MKKSQEISKGKSKEDKATTSQSRGPLRKDSKSIRQLMKSLWRQEKKDICVENLGAIPNWVYHKLYDQEFWEPNFQPDLV